MKFSLVAFAAAAFAALVDANGVCYDPDHTSSKSASTVAADMSTIAGYGFDSVRTYISYFGNTEMGPIITAAGLTAALGVPYPQSDYSSQATAAIKAANSGGVTHIFVGNENLAGASSVPSAMIELIYSIKSQVPGSVKVGTVQRNTEVINYASISGWSDLVSACDVLGVNVHPFFTSGTSASTAMALVKTQWNTMYSNFGSKLLLTETGWPTGGSYAGNTGSVSGLETFYSDYNSWRGSQSQSYFFQMFDTPSKSESYEQVFGLLTYDSQSKFGMSTTTSAPSTTAPATTTPAPTTQAPTPEPTTEAPTATPEATEAETEAPTATPEPTEAETSSASTDAELEPLDGSASSGSLSSLAGSNSTASDADDDDTVGSYDDDSVADEADAGTSKTSLSSTDSTTAAGTAAGTSGTSDAQRTAGADSSQNSEKANTQSEGSSSGTYVGLAVAGGACAAMVAFGFIYQTRKRAQELEEMDDKREDSWPSAVTPVENINVL